MTFITKCNITLEQLEQFIHYDPEEGTLHFKNRQTGEIGIRIGCDYVTTKKHPLMPKSIQTCGSVYRPAMIAWYLAYREWPNGIVICKDGNDLNLRKSNLVLKSQVPPGSLKRIKQRLTVSLIHGQWIIRRGSEDLKRCETINEMAAELRKLVKEPKQNVPKNTRGNWNQRIGEDDQRNIDPAGETEQRSQME